MSPGCVTYEAFDIRGIPMAPKVSLWPFPLMPPSPIPGIEHSALVSIDHLCCSRGTCACFCVRQLSSVLRSRSITQLCSFVASQCWTVSPLCTYDSFLSIPHLGTQGFFLFWCLWCTWLLGTGMCECVCGRRYELLSGKHQEWKGQIIQELFVQLCKKLTSCLRAAKQGPEMMFQVF